jgi:hypothetical protein
MTLTENNFQAAVKLGGIALALSVVFNIYLVMRNREVYRDQVQGDLRFQQMMLQEQAMEGVAREFIALAAKDAKIAEILQRHQIIGGAMQQPQQVKP